MKSTWDTFSFYIDAGGLQKFRESIVKCLDSDVRNLTELKYVVDERVRIDNKRATHTSGNVFGNSPPNLSNSDTYVDIISRELYKHFDATGLDW